ncbi:hypothetical protein PAMA_004977 [Pampus argenteus]
MFICIFKASSSEIKASVANFSKLVHTLVDNQCQRDVFYQKIFPTVFGPKYDSALQALMRKFLISLQKLLPVPNLEQTSLWLSLSPSILKECVEFMNQPEPLNTLIQRHKHHGHDVPQALSSPGDDCIFSSLSYQLLKVDKGDIGCSLESKEDEKSEMTKNVESNEQDGADSPEDQGASVEVILPFDESESNDNDKKCYHHLKTCSRTSEKTFKGLVCGQEFASVSKLKRHKITQSGCLMNRLGESKSTCQSSFKINLHHKPTTSTKTNISRSENETPLLTVAKLNYPPNVNSLPDSEKSNEICSLVCPVCGKVFTYPKNFDKHQKMCVDASKQKSQTEPHLSINSSHHFKPNPGEKTRESLSHKTDTGPSEVVLQESDSPVDQMCKRSSRVKTRFVRENIFTCSADLTRHVQCHTERSSYVCFYCGKDFESYEDCKMHHEGKCKVSHQHLQVNDSRNTSKMTRDNIVITSGIVWIPTISEASTSPQTVPAMLACKSSLTCRECGQGFTYYKSFEKHQSKCSKKSPRRKKQTNSNHFVISACNFRSADNANEISAETETQERETAISADRKDCYMKCTMCEKNFSELVHMKRHYSKLHKVRGPYPCTLCKRTFVRLCELVRHQQNKKLYQCTACNKCYTKPGLLNHHEKVHTASVTPRICETCGRSFKSLAYLILHQSKHKERQPSVCSYCGKQFRTKDCLRAHLVRHTGGYPCTVCGKKFYQKTYLKWHLYKHTGQEPYLCDTCGKGWPNAAQLKLHMIQHTEERPFKCEDCGACYKRGSHLMAHRRSKHSRLRPFVCEVCSKAFRLNNELKKHMMVHTGERPYQCSRCGKTFTRKSRLREHREKACL